MHARLIDIGGKDVQRTLAIYTNNEDSKQSFSEWCNVFINWLRIYEQEVRTDITTTTTLGSIQKELQDVVDPFCDKSDDVQANEVKAVVVKAVTSEIAQKVAMMGLTVSDFPTFASIDKLKEVAHAKSVSWGVMTLLGIASIKHPTKGTLYYDNDLCNRSGTDPLAGSWWWGGGGGGVVVW